MAEESNALLSVPRGADFSSPFSESCVLSVPRALGVARTQACAVYPVSTQSWLLGGRQNKQVLLGFTQPPNGRQSFQPCVRPALEGIKVSQDTHANPLEGVTTRHLLGEVEALPSQATAIYMGRPQGSSPKVLLGALVVL